MIVITATRARRKVYWMLEQVQAGETFLVTRYGKPVAKLLPPLPVDPRSAKSVDLSSSDEAGSAVAIP